MQLVENDAAQRAEQIWRIGGREQQRQLLRGGQQHVGRMAALALTFRCRRVAGTGLDPDRQRHFRNRDFKVAGDVDRERLQRRNVKRVQAVFVPLRVVSTCPRLRGEVTGAQLDQTGQKSRQGLATAGRRDQQRRTTGARLGQEFELMRARVPATAGKPAHEDVRKHGRPIDDRHALFASASQWLGVAMTTSPETGSAFSVRMVAFSRVTSCKPAAATAPRK